MKANSMNLPKRLEDTLNALYMQGEHAGKENYDSATHQITAVKLALKDIEQDILELIGEDDKHFFEARIDTDIEWLVDNCILPNLATHSASVESCGRLHEIIEAFQNGAVSANYYSKRHAEITDKLTNQEVEE